jgi:hypothetical protein
MKTFVGLMLVLVGAVILAGAVVVLVFAVLATLFNWQWDGPVLWDQVLLLMIAPPAVVGTGLLALGYRLAAKRA